LSFHRISASLAADPLPLPCLRLQSWPQFLAEAVGRKKDLRRP